MSIESFESTLLRVVVASSCERLMQIGERERERER